MLSGSFRDCLIYKSDDRMKSGTVSFSLPTVESDDMGSDMANKYKMLTTSSLKPRFIHLETLKG